METLRGLRPPQLLAGQRAGHAAGIRACQSVGHGKAWQNTSIDIEAAYDAADQLGVDKGPRPVMDEDVGRRVGGQRLKPGVNRVLAMRAAYSRRPQACGKVRCNKLVERGIVRMDYHDNVVHARVTGKRADGPSQYLHAANWQILL